MRVLRPTESYEISLPDDVLEKYDEAVSSFWRPQSNVALQLSSRVRHCGAQVGARERLDDSMRITTGISAWFLLGGFRGDWCPETAAAKLTTSDGLIWTHVYLVWPDLAVYATISRPPNEDVNAEAWAVKAVKSIRRVSDN
jgi:hypothetical protein